MLTPPAGARHECRAPRRLVIATLLALGTGACGQAPELAVEERPLAAAASSVSPASGGGAAGPPQVVALDPPNGALGVDPSRTTLSVTFDRPMQPEGWSWVQESPASSPEFLEEAAFDPSGATNTVAVRLAPGRAYVVWINSPEFDYFRDLTGRPATPFRWSFSTAAGKAPVGASPGLLPSHGRSGPRVVELDPVDGAADVDPGQTWLRVTFDRPMAGGWSWVEDATGRFPDRLEDAYFEPDRRANVLPVELEPNSSYVVWLNSADFQYFQSTEGEILTPVRWAFRTGAAR